LALVVGDAVMREIDDLQPGSAMVTMAAIEGATDWERDRGGARAWWR